MGWLGNFYIIFFSNVVFAVATILCLVNKFTNKVRQGIVLKIKMALSTFMNNHRRARSPSGMNVSN